MVEAHGEQGWLSFCYPLMTDGLIYAASMVLLNDARRGHKGGHWLAYLALGLGMIATLAANVAAGLASGPIGAIIAAWPAPALVVSYELLMLVIRRSARPAPATAAEAEVPVPAPPAELNGHGHAAAELFAADLASGSVPGIRRIRKELKVGQPRAQQVREYLSELATAYNGHAAGGDA